MLSLTENVKFIEGIFGSGRLSRDSRNFDVCCPLCDPKDNSKKKLSILIPEHRLHCWTCGYKGASLSWLIRKFAPGKFEEYRDKFMSEAQKASWAKASCRVLHVDVVDVSLPADFTLLTIANQYDPDVKALFRYLTARGITLRDMWHYRIGYSNDPRWQRRVIVPSFDATGKLNYFVGRAIDQRRKPKYDNPDVDKLPVTFNELNIDWSQRLVLCEGVFDMFKCGENTCPLLGSDLSNQSATFSSIISHSTPVALALDSDMWQTKTLRVAKKLAEYDVDVKIVDTRPFGDPGSTTKLQFKEALDAAIPFSWQHALFNRLERAAKTTLAVR